MPYGFAHVLNNAFKFASKTLLEDSVCLVGLLGSSNSSHLFVEWIQLFYQALEIHNG